MQWQGIIALLLAIMVLFPAAFVAYVNAGSFYTAIRYSSGKSRAGRREEIASYFCTIDTDCPPGYVCLNGHCVPQKS